MLGDLDEDEVADYAIGADRANASGTQSGQVTIYSGATGKPLRRIPGFAAWSGFGWSIAPLGDLDRDGSPDFAVGADWENHGKWDRAGCVRVFSGRDGQVLHTHYGSGPKRLFGFAIAPAGDVDRDGHLDLAVHSSGSRHSDALRIISGRTGAALASYPGKGWFGYSMALLGDVTANGHADLLVANHTAGFVSILEGAQLVRPPGR